jgi:hypothetical protein
MNPGTISEKWPIFWGGFFGEIFGDSDGDFWGQRLFWEEFGGWEP